MLEEQLKLAEEIKNEEGQDNDEEVKDD